METIKFKEAYDIYNTSEVAGFDDKKAKELVDMGIAEYYPRKKSKQKPNVNKMVDGEETEDKQVKEKLTLDDLKKKAGGWYEFPDGKSVRGKDSALERLEEWNEEG